MGDRVRLPPRRGEILSCMLNPLAFSKPLMEGYMECRDGTPFLKERWGFIFSESGTREIECKENRPDPIASLF